MEQLTYDEYRWDGDPNSHVDAPLNSELRELSRPVRWRKTTGKGIKTGWIVMFAGLDASNAELKAQTASFVIDPTFDNNKTFYCHNDDGSFNITLPNFTGRCVFDVIITTAATAKFVAGSGATAIYRVSDTISTRKINAVDTITRVMGINGEWRVLNNMVAE